MSNEFTRLLGQHDCDHVTGRNGRFVCNKAGREVDFGAYCRACPNGATTPPESEREAAVAPTAPPPDAPARAVPDPFLQTR